MYVIIVILYVLTGLLLIKVSWAPHYDIAPCFSVYGTYKRLCQAEQHKSFWIVFPY